MIAHLPLRKHLLLTRLFKKIAPWLVFAVAIICCNPVSAQNALDKLGLSSSTPATGAYALRLLSSAFTGPLVRININNVYYDVYPDASGVLSLTSAISASYVNYNDAKTGATANTFSSIITDNNATVAIWYDQGGSGNDEVQADVNYQPFIVLGGAILTNNGVPAMQFSGRFLRAVLPSLDPATSHTLISVASADRGNIVALSSAEQPYGNSCLGAGRFDSKGTWFGGYFQDNYYETGTSNSAITIRTKTYTIADSTIRGYQDGGYIFKMNTAIALNVINPPYTPYNLSTPDILLGYQCMNSSGMPDFQPLNGYESEVLVFATALNTDARQAIESNEAAYFGISYTHDAPPAPAVASPLTLDKAGLSGSVQATAAYSVRQLSSAYTGPLVRLSYYTGHAPLY